MSEKMQGYLAQLKTFTSDGSPVGSEYVFKPKCDWWIGALGDYLSHTRYNDIGAVVDAFGQEASIRVAKGEIVEAEVDVPQEEVNEKGLRKVSCPVDYDVEKVISTIKYPFPDGKKEYLRKKE